MKIVMKTTAVLCGMVLALGLGLASAAKPALAAHAGAPYTNVDPRNDRGNDTGDSQIDGLNQSQLDQNYWQNALRPGGVPNPPYYAPQTAPR
jgi:hypothetical protein